MNSLQYREPNNRPFQERQFSNVNYLPSQFSNAHSPSRSKITFTHNQNMPQSIALPQSGQNTQQFQYMAEKKFAPLVARQQPEQANQESLLQRNYEKKFTPISFDKETVGRKSAKIDQHEYAKKTIQTVMVGFLILILIVGTFYGIILWDKSNPKAETQVNSGNSVNINSNTNVSPKPVNISGGSQIIQPAQTEWTKLPQDEQSPLDALEVVGILTGAHKLEQTSIHSELHSNHMHVRRHNI